MRIQATIDSLNRMERLHDPVISDFLLYLHREIYQGTSMMKCSRLRMVHVLYLVRSERVK
ncbi:MAG: hypothetical protein EBT06_09990 [Gammaproteobacteria bacterium]|nr:hypothetical protein [Gammaproteobacteria bacterium]NBT45232.1 hypothetical protein [Gammaproteobacteria bacterium]